MGSSGCWYLRDTKSASGILVGSASPGAMTTERSPSTKRTRLSASCLVGAVRLPAEAVRRMTYVLPPWWITHWSARSSVDCAGRSPSEGEQSLRCGLVDAGAQVGPLVLRRGAVWSAFVVPQRVASYSVAACPPLQLFRVAS